MKCRSWSLMVLMMTVLASGCASRKEREAKMLAQQNAEEQATRPFEQGLKALEIQDYAEAARIFDQLLVSKPATEYDLSVLFNSASAYEGMRECARAADRYRQLIRSSANRFKVFEAQAFYRLSYMYECQGQTAKAITALLDARKRAAHLPFATQAAEIPARLAVLYARMGNRQKALEFFNIANSGLKRIVATESGRKQQETLAKTLFLMGQMDQAKAPGEGDPMPYILGLSMQQPYLLQAIEMGHPVWSKRATEELMAAYDNIWLFRFSDSEKQNQFYLRTLQAIRELERLRMPARETKADPVFAKLNVMETRLQNEMARVAESTRLTPEAEKREGLRREGRLVNPTPTKPAKKR